MGILEMDFEIILGVPFFHSSSHTIMLCTYYTYMRLKGNSIIFSINISKYVLILLIEFDARKPKKVIQIHITHVAFADSLFEHYIYVLLLKVGVTVAKMDTFMPPKMNACSSLSRNMNNPTDTNCLCPL